MNISNLVFTFLSSWVVVFGTWSFQADTRIIPAIPNYWDFSSWYVNKLEYLDSRSKESLRFSLQSGMIAMYMVSAVWLIVPHNYLKDS